MTKHRAVFLLGAVVVLAAVAGGYLWVFERKPPAPNRPASVPSSATWVGWNKGEWIDCKPLNQARRFRCEVFADVSGDRLSSGEYALDQSANPGTAPPQLRSFDGEAIDTSGGKLVPYGPHTFHGGGKDTWTKDFGPPPAQG